MSNSQALGRFADYLKRMNDSYKLPIIKYPEVFSIRFIHA